MTAIKAHLSTTELKHRYKTATEPIAKSHLHALWLLSRGYDIDETAEVLSFSTRWVRMLIKRYNEGGPDLLGDQRVNNGTEPTILTPDALGELQERLSICGRSSTSRWSIATSTPSRISTRVGERCVALMQQREMIRHSTLFHWWPRLNAHAPHRN